MHLALAFSLLACGGSTSGGRAGSEPHPPIGGRAAAPAEAAPAEAAPAEPAPAEPAPAPDGFAWHSTGAVFVCANPGPDNGTPSTDLSSQHCAAYAGKAVRAYDESCSDVFAFRSVTEPERRFDCRCDARPGCAR